jgi:hypothetical protein
MIYLANWPIQIGEVIYHTMNKVPIDDPAEAARLVQLGALLALPEREDFEAAIAAAKAEDRPEPEPIREPSSGAVGRRRKPR